MNLLRSAFPDIRFSLDQILVEDERLALRVTARGTHQGLFMGIPATGKQVVFGGMTFIHFRNGKLAERWDITDLPGLMQQLSAGSGAQAAGRRD